MTNAPWGQPSSNLPAGPTPQHSQYPQPGPTYFGALPSHRPPLLPPGRLDLAALFGGTWAVLQRKAGLLLGITLVSSLVAALIILIPASAMVVLVILATVVGFEGEHFDPTLPFWAACTAVVLCGALVGAAGTWVWARFTSMMVAVVDQLARGFEPTWNTAEAQVSGATGRARVVVWLGAALGAAVVLPVVGAFVWMAFTASPPSTAWIGRIMVALPLLVLVGIYLQVRLVFMLPALVLEGHRGLGVLRRSLALTRGRFWRTLGLLLVGGGIPVALNATLNGSSQWLQDNPDTAVVAMVLGLLGSVVSLLVQVWTQVWQMLMYVDVRRDEGGGRQVVAPAPAPPTAAPPAPTTPGYAEDIPDDDSPWARRDGEGL